MKVLQINVTYEKASTGRTCLELAEFMKKKGIEVRTASASHLKRRKENYIILSKVGRLIHLLFREYFGLEGFLSFLPTLKLLFYIENYKPDILHLRVLHGAYINIFLLFKYIKLKKIPVVWTFHDCWAYTGKCAYYTKNNCYKWKNGSCSRCTAIKEYPKSKFFDFSKLMYTKKKKLFTGLNNCHIVTVSNWLKNETMKSFFKEYEISYIYNSINLNIFKPIDTIEKKLFKDKIVILGVASGWSERKGIDIFLKLSKIIPKNMIVVLIGNYDKRKYSNSETIHFINGTNNIKELVEWYNIANVFLNLSIEETFGKVSAEALACGTPVITNKYTANKELVDENTGIVLESLDENTILGAINKIISLPKNNYSNLCRKRAEKLFNYQTNQNLYYQLYKKVLNYKK